jgi:hypothetical protein
MAFGLYGQQLEKSVIPIAGISPGQNFLTATAGEIVGGSFDDDLVYIGHGFQNSTVSIMTSHHFVEIGDEIRLFPNPAVDHLYVKISSSPTLVEYRYQIIDQWGQTVRQGKLYSKLKNRIQANLLSPGQYYFKIYKEGKPIVLSFLIVK